MEHTYKCGNLFIFSRCLLKNNIVRYLDAEAIRDFGPFKESDVIEYCTYNLQSMYYTFCGFSAFNPNDNIKESLKLFNILNLNEEQFNEFIINNEELEQHLYSYDNKYPILRSSNRKQCKIMQTKELRDVYLDYNSTPSIAYYIIKPDFDNQL